MLLTLVAKSSNESQKTATLDSNTSTLLSSYQSRFLSGSREGKSVNSDDGQKASQAAEFFATRLSRDENRVAVEKLGASGFVDRNDIDSVAGNSDQKKSLEAIFVRPLPESVVNAQNSPGGSSSPSRKSISLDGNVNRSNDLFCSTTLMCTISAGASFDVGPDFWWAAMMCAVIDSGSPGTSLLRYATNCNGNISFGVTVATF